MFNSFCFYEMTIFFNLVFLNFICFFVLFWHKRGIKMEQKCIFVPIFNRCGL